jgi:tryptophan 2,3-dioxygenase
MLRHHDAPLPMRAALERRFAAPSLRDVFFEALDALGIMPPLDPDAPDAVRFAARARAILALYRDERHFRDWIDLCERLTEFDELIVSWRLRHVQLVERTIGLRMGTGGSAGSSYLKMTIDKRFFPELWEARTLLVDDK